MSEGTDTCGSAEPVRSKDAEVRKETPVAYEWQSVEEAAVTLGVSTRTLHRRISKGEVETRLEDGRREVLVCLPDPEPEAIADEQVEVTDMPAVQARVSDDVGSST